MGQQFSQVLYYNTNYLEVENNGISAWQGSRAIDEDIFLLCGTTKPNPQKGIGLIYSGNISFTDGNIYYMNVPDSLYTSVYGPNYDSETGIFNFVGSFQTQSNKTKGFIYTGTLSDASLSTTSNYTYPSVNIDYDIVFVHSIINGYCVGNAGNFSKTGETINQDTIAFLYNIQDLSNPIEVSFPNSQTTTVYGIWYNKNKQTYTIVGGFSLVRTPISRIYSNNKIIPIGQAFIVDYDPKSNIFINWTALELPVSKLVLSHIEGISGFYDLEDIYTICIDTISLGYTNGYYATIIRDSNDKFKIRKFVEVKYPMEKSASTINSVANNNIVGLSISPYGNQSFQATILD